MTAVECTAGLRVAKALQSLAVPDENLLDFINIIYLRCKEIGLDPQKFPSLAKQLLDLTNSVPIVQIPQYLEDKQREKSQLEQDIGDLREQEAKAKFDLELALNEQQITTSQLSIFSEQRTRLEAAGVSVGDLELVTRCIEGAKKLAFDIKRLTMLLSDFDFSRAMQVELEKSIESSKTHLQHLKYECDILESQISMHNITILKLRQLEDMGLGIPQLLVLHETAHEIARAYKIPQNLAVQRLLNDVVENYADATDLEGKVQQLRSEKIMLENQKLNLNLSLGSLKEPIELLAQMLRLGYSQPEIISAVKSIAESHRDSDQQKDILDLHDEENFSSKVEWNQIASVRNSFYLLNAKPSLQVLLSCMIPCKVSHTEPIASGTTQTVNDYSVGTPEE